MPRILRIINRFNLGGPTYNAAYLTKYLPDRFETLLVGGMKDASEDSSQFIVENLGITPMVLPEMYRDISLRNDMIAYRRIKELIEEFKPDIVHTHASKPGALGRWAAHKANVPVIIHTFHGHVFHSYFNPTKTAVYKSLERKLASVSTRIIAISEKQKEELALEHHICPPDKVEVVPLGFDLARFSHGVDEMREVFREEYHLGDTEVAVGIVGRLVPIKNHRMFLDAMKWVRDHTDKKVKGFIVGDGESGIGLEKYAEEIGLRHTRDSSEEADVYFAGWVKKIEYVIAGLDVVALTSKNEGTPVSLIEAQAGERPIVTTRVGGIEDVVLPGKSALLSEPNDLQTFQENLLKMVNDRAIREKFGIAGSDFVRHKFHYGRLIDDFAALYDRLLEEKGYKPHN